MFRLTLRKKLLLFTIVIAIVPLLVAGRTMIRIAEDELKSSVNEQLVTTAEELAHEIDTLFQRTWLAPFLLIRKAIDNESLGVEEKIALLKAGVADSPDIVALQVTVEGSQVPLLVTRDDFVARLKAAYLDPLHVLQVPGALMFRSEVNLIGRDVTYLKETDSWLATVTLPLSETAMGAEATLLARIDLRRLRNHVEEHRFNQTGSITIVDRFARRIFDPEQPDLRRYLMVGEAMGLLASGARVVRTARYAGPDGRVLLGAYAFPRPLKWAVLVEKDEADAYLFITQMTQSLLLWGLVGLGVAVAGAILLAVRISRPILEIARVTVEVAKGNFQARVGRGAELKDENGDLARCVNDMTTGLNERVHLQKFVSGGTIGAIRLAKGVGISLGGRGQGDDAFLWHSRLHGIRRVLSAGRGGPGSELLFQHLTEIVAQNEGHRPVRRRSDLRRVPGRRHGAQRRALRDRHAAKDGGVESRTP